MRVHAYCMPVGRLSSSVRSLMYRLQVKRLYEQYLATVGVDAATSTTLAFEIMRDVSMHAAKEEVGGVRDTMPCSRARQPAPSPCISVC